jgi:CBS-domain-containing membrane protein
MQKKQLSALPVYDLKQNRFAGLIDVVDISHHLTNSSHHSNAKEFFKTSKVSAVYNPNLKSYFVGITPATPLDTAVLLMSEQRVHRLPVVSAEDPQKLIGLLTQSQILRWIGPNLGEAAKAVVDLGSAPVSLPSTATIKDAINLLHSKRLMGLPIIDGGSVIGDFNLGDLELLGPEQVPSTFSPPTQPFLLLTC